MDSEEKCKMLASEIRNVLDRGITLGKDVIHFIDSTFSNPTAAELQNILQDDSNCEKDSLIELLLFPDEAMQLQLETSLERLKIKTAEEKSLPDYLARGPLQVTIRFPGDRGCLNVILTEDIASQFISRLNISRHLNPDLRAALNRYDDENIRNRIKVKIRNSRFSATEEKIEFLCLFFEKFDQNDNDIFECLDFVCGFLEEHKQINDIYQALMAKKKFYFISLQKAKQMETQLRKHNMETLLAQGKRVVLIDQKDATKKMQIIDRISRAIFGKTQYFEPLQDGGESIELGSDPNVRDIIRILS